MVIVVRGRELEADIRSDGETLKEVDYLGTEGTNLGTEITLDRGMQQEVSNTLKKRRRFYKG